MHKQSKPDDRSDNAEKIEYNIQHTQENWREANDYLKAHQNELSAQEKQQVETKNLRREAAIEGFREEIKDEI